jgi:hypothetical protein
LYYCLLVGISTYQLNIFLLLMAGIAFKGVPMDLLPDKAKKMDRLERYGLNGSFHRQYC